MGGQKLRWIATSLEPSAFHSDFGGEIIGDLLFEKIESMRRLLLAM